MEKSFKLEIVHIYPMEEKLCDWNCGIHSPNTTDIHRVTCSDCLHKYIDLLKEKYKIQTKDKLEKQPKSSISLNQLVKETHEVAKKRGWWSPANSDLENHMLMVTEIAEATEEIRNNKPHYYVVNNKPEGEAIELADVIIRIADYFGHKGWDLEFMIREKMKYNETRPNRHGGKKH